MIEIYFAGHIFASIFVTWCAEQRCRNTAGWCLLALFFTPWFAILCLIACGDGAAKRAKERKLLADAICSATLKAP
jgi:hypothetical protein